MKKVYKNYKSMFFLLVGIILGGVIGVIFKEKASVLAPFGNLFINMLLVIIVPLIFLTITTSIGSMNAPKRFGKIVVTTILVFVVTSVISTLVGLMFTRVRLVDVKDSNKIIESLNYDSSEKNESINFLDKTVNTISTNDFVNLLSKDNMIALIVFSSLVGFAILKCKEKAKPFLNVLVSMNEVLQKVIKIIMYYAPVGLGCYFASFVGNFGSSIGAGYLKTFVIYVLASLFVYFIVYSVYAFLSAGVKGFKNYWKNILPPTLTALSTCSSAASIPSNTMCAKKIGVKNDVADMVVPLGTSFHKDGSIVGSAFKIMFLVYLFNSSISSGKIILVSLVATLLVTAIPIGGGTISEMLIITSLGFPVAALPILTIIATIIDAPATVLNVVGDSASAMMVSRIVDGKEFVNSVNNS